MDSIPRAGGSARRSITRVLLGPLLGYHLLILVGAAILVTSLLSGNRDLEVLGGSLVAAGIAVQLVVLHWTFTLARGARSSPIFETSSSLGGDPGVGRWFCPHCGWSGSARARLCPVCYRPTVRSH